VYLAFLTSLNHHPSDSIIWIVSTSKGIHIPATDKIRTNEAIGHLFGSERARCLLSSQPICNSKRANSKSSQLTNENFSCIFQYASISAHSTNGSTIATQKHHLHGRKPILINRNSAHILSSLLLGNKWHGNKFRVSYTHAEVAAKISTLFAPVTSARHRPRYGSLDLGTHRNYLSVTNRQSL
jgi:hypothetical protein